MRAALALGSAVVAVALAVLLGWRVMYSPSGPERWVRVSLPEGVSLTRAVRTLADSGLVAHPQVFVLWARLAARDRSIQAGTYLLSPAMTPAEILDYLVRGQVVSSSVTIPEGVTLVEIASILQAKVGVDSSLFVQLCHHDSLIAALGISAPSLEGYLFPDTYSLSVGIRADRVASIMVARLRAILGEIDWDEELTELSLHEILTLASIVEKETAVPSERPTVAAVYLNRLKIGMKLDADPTVAYALGKPGSRLTLEDLRHPSPYNTYLNPGLPPGPICSPGLGSINAVLHPDRECRALYFVAKGDGSHRFSETFAEHRMAIQEYRRSRSSAP